MGLQEARKLSEDAAKPIRVQHPSNISYDKLLSYFDELEAEDDL